MPFRYLRDPLFLVCFAGYWGHRWLAHHGMSAPLLRAHFNDLICVPFWIPMMLWACRKLRLRRHDGPPDAVEVVVPVVIWSALFEVLIPAQTVVRVPTVADPKDVLAYCIGSLVAVVFWRWHYGPCAKESNTKGENRVPSNAWGSKPGRS